MLKGLMMASGWLTLYALNWKDANYRWALLFSLLNFGWLFAVMFCFFEHENPIALAVCIIISIAYPAVVAAFGIRNRKKAKGNESEENEKE